MVSVLILIGDVFCVLFETKWDLLTKLVYHAIIFLKILFFLFCLYACIIGFDFQKKIKQMDFALAMKLNSSSTLIANVRRFCTFASTFLYAAAWFKQRPILKHKEVHLRCYLVHVRGTVMLLIFTSGYLQHSIFCFLFLLRFANDARTVLSILSLCMISFTCRFNRIAQTQACSRPHTRKKQRLENCCFALVQVLRSSV